MSVIGWFMSGDVNKSTWVSCPVRRAEVREGSVQRGAAAAAAAAASADAVAAAVVRRGCCPSKEKYCAMSAQCFLLGYHLIFELANYLRISCGFRLHKSFVSKEKYCAMCFLWWLLLLFPRNSLSVRECTVFFC